MTLEVDIKRRLGEFSVDAAFTSAPGITALFGRSGAGKSSIINMISGLLRPDSGRIVVDGRVLCDGDKGIHMPPRKRRIGYVFQESRLFPHLKVRRNLLYGQRFTPRAEQFVDFDQIVDLLGIHHLLDQRPPALSGGERQRVAIGRALLTSPRLLLMDEPLASLDVARKNEILPYIERLRDQFRLPVVYVSHAFNEVARLADQLIVLADGRVKAAGSVTQVTGSLAAGIVMGRDQAGSVIEARVIGHDDSDGLTRLRSQGGDLIVPYAPELTVASTVRVHIHALDVAIATQRPVRVSIQNILPAQISEISVQGSTHAEIRLDAAGMPIIAHITQKALRELQLEVGHDVFALVKSVAVSGKDSLSQAATATLGGVRTPL